MTEGNNDRVTPMELPIRNGHGVTYVLEFHRLSYIDRTFYPLEYVTQCPTTPTSWRLKLLCQQVPGDSDSYNFSVSLKRMDHSATKVKVSLLLSIIRADGIPFFSPKILNRDRMVHDDELEDTIINISQTDMLDEVAVIVNIQIQHCHSETH